MEYLEQFETLISSDFMNQLPELAAQISQKVTIGLSVIGLILALSGCFFGYRMLKFWISFSGFIVGASVGYILTNHLTENATYALVGMIAGALLLAVLAYKIYLMGVFFLCGAGGYFLAMSALPLKGTTLTAVSIALGIVIAILAVTYMRPAIITITGLGNGLAIAGILPKLVVFPNPSLILPLGVGIGMLGCAFQFMTTRSKKEKRRRKEA